ncbi:MAG: sterol desaturase family protein [Paracoccaceae bacterium]
MQNEATIRLGVFLILLALFALLEAVLPRRARVQPRQGRWRTNLSITVLNTLALRAMALVVPLLAVGAALDAGAMGWGLLNQVDWPLWAEVILAILLFDLAIWTQHLVTHKVPILWRFHRMHHADRDMDVTTALRFHPVEILASMGLKIALVYALGPAALAVVLFEILLNGTALFNHANLALPRGLDRVLRLVLVTPDMHQIHHSTRREEHDSNYGFALSIWDRLFRTYVAAPRAGLVTGLQWQDERPSKLGWSLWLPFR